jgi:hypothetical protein
VRYLIFLDGSTGLKTASTTLSLSKLKWGVEMNTSQVRRRAATGGKRKAGFTPTPSDLSAAVGPPDAGHANYTVFFSHRFKDKHVAHSIKELLTNHTANVEYFVSEDIEKGENWRRAITEQLHNSRFLVLVFTDPDEDWSWCLYETGFFDALARADKTQTRRIHCLHHPNTGPPKPIADLQTVPATPEDVTKWLTYLFDETQQNKTPFRDDHEIPQLANEICRFFESGRRPLYSAKSVNIEVDCRLLGSPDDLPANSTVQGDFGLMAELFGAHTGTLDWSSVKNRFERFPNSSEVNLNALKEISRALYSISRNIRVLPLQSTIFVEQGPKRYRPVISYAKELYTGRISCEILLIEEVGGPLQNVDKRLGALLTALRMAIRIRWEIVRPFVVKSNVRILSDINARKLRFDLQTCFNNIFIEAEFRGNFSPSDVWAAFETDADKNKFENMIKDWDKLYQKIWKSIGFSHVRETYGEVSAQAFSNEDIRSLVDGMRELEKMNRDFLDMAVARAKSLVHEELGVASSDPPVTPITSPSRRSPRTIAALAGPDGPRQPSRARKGRAGR